MNVLYLGYYLAIAFLIILGSIGIIISLREYRRHDEPFKTLARVLCESFVLFGFGTALGVALSVFYSPDMWGIMAASATLGYLLLVVSVLRMLRGLKARKRVGKKLPVPNAILIESPEDALNLLRALYRYARVPLMVVTRTPPEEWTARSGVIPDEYLWLSRVEAKNSVSPTDLHVILQRIERFLMQNPGVIYVDGIEYLLFYNDFKGLAKFLISAKDIAVLHGGHIVLLVAPGALKKVELSILRKEFERVNVGLILKEVLGPTLFETLPSELRGKENAGTKGPKERGRAGEEKAEEAEPLRRKEEAEEGR
ncbi:DUF835 domain-containing protein [Thermococcus sp.]|uniref:DUF835 domain-containing protein n=1 Tax=Thermococcus sp. TaxID=35749 RepID=UPI002633C227|nr:DUF835 domain-containing protein [Thermococcus sp.]